MGWVPIASSTGISKDEINLFSSHEEIDLVDGKLQSDIAVRIWDQSAATTKEEKKMSIGC